jgi:hypothetical protein
MELLYDSAGVFYDSSITYDSISSPQNGRSRVSKTKLGLSTLTPDEIVALAETIITAMTGNANFVTPIPTLPSMTTLKTTAATKIAAYNSAVAGASSALTDRDAAVMALAGGLTQLAAYVESITGGDRVKIESAGMSVRATPAPVGPMPQVQNLVATASDFDGSLDIGWDAVYGAGSYEVHTSADPVTAASWAYKDMSNKSTITLNSFTSGSKVWVRVRAMGANNQKGPWSDPAGKTVP